MPVSTIDDIFHYITINRIVSRLAGPSHRLMTTYGLGPGGANTDDVGGSIFAWDLFDLTRKIAPGRARASGPSSSSPQSVGNVTATCYRMFDQVPIDYDRIYRRRGLGESLGSLDVTAQKYLVKQVGHQAERFMNAREIIIMWMFRGGFELKVVGDEVQPVPPGTGGEIVVDFRHPDSNEGDVEGVFAQDWELVTAKIIDELLDLNRHSAQLARYPQQIGWINAELAGFILQNTQVKDTGGTANIVFGDGADALRHMGQSDDGATLSNILSFVLRGYPIMRWMVYDDQIDLLDGTRESFIPKNNALFTPAPSSSWLEWKNGSELTQRAVTAPIQDTFGFAAWQETQRNPVAISMYMLDNGLPAPYVPAAWYFPKVASA